MREVERMMRKVERIERRWRISWRGYEGSGKDMREVERMKRRIKRMMRDM